MKDIGLTDLIDKAVLQQIQDGFSRFTGMAALITDNTGAPVTEGSGFTDFCTKLTRNTELGRQRCAECDKNGALLTLRNEKAAVYRCHAGLCDFAAPIMVDGKFIGSVIGGQVRTDPVDKTAFALTANSLGIDPDEYIEAAERTAVMEYSSIEKAAEFLRVIAGVLSDMAYNNNVALTHSRKLERAARSQSAYMMNMSISMEKNINDWMMTAKQAVNSGDSAVMESSIKELLDKSSDVHTLVGDTVDYIRMSGEDVELTETVYSPSYLVNQITDSVRETAAASNISLTSRLESSVPEHLLGDTGKVCQIVSKLLGGCISYSAKGSHITLDYSCRKRSYASVLNIKITSDGLSIPTSQFTIFADYFTTLPNIEYIDADGTTDYSLTSAAVTLKQMSGKVRIIENSIGGTSLVISIPQLEVRQ